MWDSWGLCREQGLGSKLLEGGNMGEYIGEYYRGY